MPPPYVLAPDYENAGCVLVALPVALVPLVTGALQKYERRYLWATDADYERGYNALAEIQAQMSNKCLQELIDSNNQIYRLLDTALNGTQYSTVTNPADPTRPTVLPPIPFVPPASTSAANALRAHVGRLWQLAENAATGASYAAGSGIAGSAELDFDGSWRARLNALQGTQGGFFGIGAQPVTLADLLRAGRVNTAADQGLINDGVEEILTAVSQGTNIADVLSGLLATGADVATDGGVIAATIAAATASAASNALLQQQIASLTDAVQVLTNRLLGEPDPMMAWPGLPSVLGSLSDGDGNSMLFFLNQIEALINAGLFANVSEPSYLARIAAELQSNPGLTTYQAIERLFGAIGSVDNKVGQLASPIASIALTVTEIQDCVCNDNGGGDNPLGPTNACPGLFSEPYDTCIRIVEWEYGGPATSVSANAHIWRPLWTSTGDPFGTTTISRFSFFAAPIGNFSGVQFTSGEQYEWRLQWDFTGGTAPLQYSLAIADSSNVEQAAINLSPSPIQTGSITSGGASLDFDTNGPPIEDGFMVINFVFEIPPPDGPLPPAYLPANVFAGGRRVPS